MSYCRFSSDDYQCEVYCYEQVGGGFVTHVASNRYVGEVPKAIPLNHPSTEEIMSAHRDQMEWLRTASSIAIGLPHDGCCFVDDSAGECADRLESLRNDGYRVPQFAIDRLRSDTP